MSISSDVQRNKLIHLENSSVMYGVYNEETLEKLVKTSHALHSCQSLVEDIFAGQMVPAYKIYSQMQNTCSVQHHTMNACYICKLLKKNILLFIMNL